MAKYRTQLRELTIDASSNLIPLRADIHWLWDQLEFFCAKFSGLVAHVSSGNPELLKLYHNVKLQPVPSVAVEYLFARFAWALFPSISTSLQTSVSRLLSLSTKDGQVEKDVTGSQCQGFTKVPSQASKKRSRPSELEPISESRVEEEERKINSETSDEDIDQIDTVEWRWYQQRRES